MPVITAMFVVIFRIPFARLTRSSRTISGIMPYFAGLKNVDCVASKTIAVIVSQRLFVIKPTPAVSARGSSTTFIQIATVRFETRSASGPAQPEKRIKGTNKQSATSPCPPSPSSPPHIPLTTAKLKSVLRMLSFAAPMNCATSRAESPRFFGSIGFTVGPFRTDAP